jgi:hypothetical protein
MENRKKAPTGTYTAREAIKTIDIPSSAFYSLVKDGTIKKIVPPGRTEGFYAKSEIDNYARNLKAFSTPYTSEKLDFGLALSEDLPAIRSLVAAVSGGLAHAVPEDILKAWIRKNPQSVHILRKSSEIVGYVSMFPLLEDTLIKRLSGQLLNRTIPIDDVQTFSPNTDIKLYIAEMAVKHEPQFLKDGEPDPDNPDPQARKLGYKLIIETARFISGLKKQGTVIKELYAVGTTPFGIELSSKLGMQPMNLPLGTKPGRVPFKLEISQQEVPESLIIKRIMAA